MRGGRTLTSLPAAPRDPVKFNPRDARAISIGIEFVVSVLLGLGAGRWLDNRFHTGPWLTLVGIVLGSAAGFRSLIVMMKENEKRAEREESEEAAKKRDREFLDERARARGEDSSATKGSTDEG